MGPIKKVSTNTSESSIPDNKKGKMVGNREVVHSKKKALNVSNYLKNEDLNTSSSSKENAYKVKINQSLPSADDSNTLVKNTQETLTFENALPLLCDEDPLTEKRGESWTWYNPTIAKEIGYKTESTRDGRLILYLLDKDALIANWNKYCTKNPELKLPPLDIVDGEGIAGDLEFVEALLHHDALLSRGKEFVHDSTAHIIPTLQRIVDAAKTKNPDGHF